MADRSVTARLRLEASQFRAELASTAGQVQAFASGTEQAVKKNREGWTAIGTGVAAVGAALSALVVGSVAQFATFDAQMSAVQAATHETAVGMDQLRQAALDAGASTVFSATESAGAVENLAKAGISTADILGGALAGSLDLAAAGGLAVEEAAETAATALSVFGLEGDQAAHVADLLAAGAGKAQGSVHDMGAALNQSALVADQLGLSIEDTTGVLAQFASAGLLGSDAGTSFRQMLLHLANPTKESRDLMRDLGIAAYDARGNFVGLESLADQLQRRLGGLTQEQRSAALATIFGADAIRSASILYEGGAEAVEQWRDAVDDSGFAAETARIRLDNLRGDLEQLSGAIETAAINAGAAADGPLRGLVQWATDAVGVFNDLPPAGQQAILLITGLVGAVGLLGGGLLILLPRLAAAKLAITELGITAAGTRTALVGLSNVLGVLAAAVLTVDLRKKISEWTGTIPEIDGLSRSLKTLGETGDVTGELLDTFGHGARGVGLTLESIGLQADSAGGSLGELIERLGRAPSGLNHTIDLLEGNYEGVKRVDQGLAELVQSGHADQAARAFAEIAEAAAAEGISISQVAAHLKEYAEIAGLVPGAVDPLTQHFLDAADEARGFSDAIGGQRSELEGVGGGAKVAAGGLSDLNVELREQAEELPELSTEQRILAERFGITAQAAIDMAGGFSEAKFQLDVLNGANVSAIDAQIRFQQAIDDAAAGAKDYEDAMADAAEAGEPFERAVTASGDALDLTTQAGRDAAAELEAIRAGAMLVYDATLQQTGSQKLANDELIKAREVLFNAAREYGLTEDAAWDYVDSVLAIPEQRATIITFDDAYARQRLGEFSAMVDYAVRRRTIRVDFDYSGITIPGVQEGLGQSGVIGHDGELPGGRTGVGDRVTGDQFGQRAAGMVGIPAWMIGAGGVGTDGARLGGDTIRVDARTFNPVALPTSRSRFTTAAKLKVRGLDSAAEAVQWVAVNR